ncbi:MAG: 3-phosphoglycerate dehydrogenase, partial [Gammaproteobacteria bacterium]|nr:3-phosphoglycerate dehydrogenase [Gammaproteobacteria bacterium]
FDTEPLNAARGARFTETPNLLLTPHIAGVTEESNVRVSELIARRVLGHLSISAML